MTNKTIQVATGVSLYINDQKLDPKDPNGNPVEPFILDGTTYLPFRAVSEALGVPIQWEGSTWSVYIGKHTSDKPAAWLKDISTFEGKDWSVDDATKDNTGVSHQAIYNTPGYAEYSYTKTYLNQWAIFGYFWHLLSARKV